MITNFKEWWYEIGSGIIPKKNDDMESHAEEVAKALYTSKFVYSAEEVKSIIQQLYSEFAELPIKMHTSYNLRNIIKQQIEKHPLKPIKIFK